MFELYPWHADLFDHFLRLSPTPQVTIITGARHTGTRALAYYCAASLLCTEPVSGHPCGQCRSCTHARAGTHEDCLYVDQDSEWEEGDCPASIGVDDIRTVLSRLTLHAHHGRYIVLLHPAELLTVSAANALLKCLEEPYTQTSFFLVVSHWAQLLPTIRSRAQCVLHAPSPTLPMAQPFFTERGYQVPTTGWETAFSAVSCRPFLLVHLYETDAVSDFLLFLEHCVTTELHGIVLADMLMADFDILRKKLPYSDSVMLGYLLDGLISLAVGVGRGRVEENDYYNPSVFLMHDGRDQVIDWLTANIVSLMLLKMLCRHPLNNRLMIDHLAYLLKKESGKGSHGNNTNGN